MLKEIIKEVIPAAFRRKAEQWKADAAKWAKHKKAKERKPKTSPPVQNLGRTKHEWDLGNYSSAPVQNLGRTQEQWKPSPRSYVSSAPVQNMGRTKERF